MRAAQVRPPAVPADYLLAHREYLADGADPGRRAVPARASAPMPT